MRGRHGAAIAPLTPPLPPKATASSTSTRPYTTYGHPHRPMAIPRTNPNAGERSEQAGAVGGQRAVKRHSLATAPSDADFGKDIAPLAPPLPPKATARSTSTRPYTTYGHPDQPKPIPHTDPNAGERNNPAGAVGAQRAVKRYSLAAPPSSAEFGKDIHVAPLTPPLPPKATASSTATRPYSTYGHPNRPKPIPHTNPNAGERSNRNSLATAPSDAEFGKEKREIPPVRKASHLSKSRFGLPPRPISFAVSLQDVFSLLASFHTSCFPFCPYTIGFWPPFCLLSCPLTPSHSYVSCSLRLSLLFCYDLSLFPPYGLQSFTLSLTCLVQGTEESLGWNFVAGGTPDVPDVPYVHQPDQKLPVDRNWWTRRVNST